MYLLIYSLVGKHCISLPWANCHTRTVLSPPAETNKSVDQGTTLTDVTTLFDHVNQPIILVHSAWSTYSVCAKQKLSMLYPLGNRLTRMCSSRSAVTTYFSSADKVYTSNVSMSTIHPILLPNITISVIIETWPKMGAIFSSSPSLFSAGWLCRACVKGCGCVYIYALLTKRHHQTYQQ